MPALFVEATAAQLLALDDERFELVMSAEALRPELRQGCNGGADKTTLGCDVDPNVFHHIDGVFNHNGVFGKGQRVAIYEDVGDDTLIECKLGIDHEAFKTIAHYEHSNPSAGCVALHGTAVASVISGYHDGTGCGASEVELYYPNQGTLATFYSDGYPVQVKTSICRPSVTLTSYEYMNDIGNPANPQDPPLAAINESYGCYHENINCDYQSAMEWEGVTQDYYARYYDLVIVKAAGNNNCGTTSAKNIEAEACPYTLNSLCVGAVNSHLEMSCFSSDNNPGTDPQNNAYDQFDREEPDLVAYGGESSKCGPGFADEGACVADYGTSLDAWMGHRGTSFAAPVVTSMVALYRAQCEEKLGARLSQLYLRALMRNAAWGANPADKAYSTPTPGQDFSDGAGFLFADALAGCPEKGVPTDFPVDLTGGDDMPVGTAPYQDGWDPPGQTQGFTQPMTYNYEPGPNSGRKKETLWEVPLVAGQRLRATVSWNGCAKDPTGFAPGDVAVDYDLFLYHQESKQYVWASQSI